MLTVIGSAIAIVVQTTDGADPGLPGADDRFSAYCAEVEQQQAALSEAFAQGPTTGLLEALPSFEALREEAPGDVADDWATVVRRITVLRDALDDADVDPTTYDPEKPPTGVTEEQRAAIAAAATALASRETQRAFETVQQEVRDVCGTPLSM